VDNTSDANKPTSFQLQDNQPCRLKANAADDYNTTDLNTALDLKAPLASPAFGNCNWCYF
jgi:hypothetical protein